MKPSIFTVGDPVTALLARRPLFSGGAESIYGPYRVHIFRATDTLTVVRPGPVEVLAVAGGGGGGLSLIHI